MERTILVLFIITSLVLLIVLACYFVTFRGGLSNNHNDWGSFGSLIGGLSMLLFSLANIKIWLYQSRITNQALNDQIMLQERISLLTGLQSKLLFVSKVHMNYKEFDKFYWESHIELKHWQFGIYDHIFDNDEGKIKAAFDAMEKIDLAWRKYSVPQDSKSNISYTDISNLDFHAELLILQEPLLTLVQHYRDQIRKS